MNIPWASSRNNMVRGLLIALLCLPGLAMAHGLLLDAEHLGDQITGTVYYSNGELAVREAVELLDLSTANAAPIAGETDDSGKFSFKVTANNRYRISAYGGEGHSVAVDLEAVANAKPTLVNDDAAAEESSWLPPAWAVIGGLLLASLVPVLLARRKQAAA
jgi:hypothetical protein